MTHLTQSIIDAEYAPFLGLEWLTEDERRQLGESKTLIESLMGHIDDGAANSPAA